MLRFAKYNPVVVQQTINMLRVSANDFEESGFSRALKRTMTIKFRSCCWTAFQAKSGEKSLFKALVILLGAKQTAGGSFCILMLSGP